MIIDCLKLHNFRLFEDVELQLNSRTCVLVGINGAGKSTLLDAMCILLSCYVGGFDGLGVRRIAQSDIRHVTHKSGSFYENVSQLPVEISAVGTLGGSSLVWKSAKLKDSPQSSSPSAYAEMTQLAKEHQLRLREGDDTLALPLIAYYGTGRLWKRETSKQRRERRLQATFRRLSVYEDCLDAHLTDTTLATWFERMTIKYLQRGGDMPEFTAVRKALSNGLQTLTGFS
ncbi:MAG: AAA family ATPase, partial [Atopobiaceae bacterium]|nr:AAA family ATPase [Atopobiaceae bacterium]